MTDAPTTETANCEATGSKAPEEKEGWVPPLFHRACDKWTIVHEEVGGWIDTELDGVNAIFGFSELSDLPPSFFFELSLPDLRKNISIAPGATE